MSCRTWRSLSILLRRPLSPRLFFAAFLVSGSSHPCLSYPMPAHSCELATSRHNMQRFGQTQEPDFEEETHDAYPSGRFRHRCRHRFRCRSVGAGHRRGPQVVREPLRALPRRRRQRRRDGSRDPRAPAGARRQGPASVDPHRRAGARHAADGDAVGRDGCARQVPAQHRAASREQAVVRATVRTTDGKTLEGSSWAKGSKTCRCSATTSVCTCCGGPVSAIAR